jgi:C1A family cysteine protease
MRTLLVFLILASSALGQVRNLSGWKQDVGGVKDRSFAAYRSGKIKALPPVVDLTNQMPKKVYDQGNIGSCTGEGIAALFSHYLWKESKRYIEPSSLFIYWNERNIEGTVNEDAGAMIRTGITVISSIGTSTTKTWPFRESRWAMKPSKPAFIEATGLRSPVGFKVDNTDGRSIRVSVSDNCPVVFGMMLYSNIERITYWEPVLSIPKKGERSIGGHCMLIVGYDDNKKLYKVRNSWSKLWGLNGYFFVPYSLIHNSRITGDCWTILPAKK